MLLEMSWDKAYVGKGIGTVLEGVKPRGAWEIGNVIDDL